MPASTAAPLVLAKEPGIWDVVPLLLCLGLILAGVFFATRFFARVAQRGVAPRSKAGGRFQPGRHIVLVDRLPLDRERCILLFEADGRRYLVGATSQQFMLLGEGEAKPQEDSGTGEEGNTSFRDFFAAWKKQGDGEHVPEK